MIEKFMRLLPDERADLLLKIGKKLAELDRIRYPYIHKNTLNDESQMALIEMIISETDNKEIYEVLDIIEINLSE